MNKNEVLSIPAGDTYEFIKKYKIHACPESKEYVYRDSEFVTFRPRKGYVNGSGVMEFFYELSKVKIIHLDPFDEENLENRLKEKYPDCLKYLPSLSGYIRERHEGCGFLKTDNNKLKLPKINDKKLKLPKINFRFYIFIDVDKYTLDHNPAPEKNYESEVYFHIDNLLVGDELVYLASSNKNTNLNLPNFFENIQDIKDEKEVEGDFLDPVKTSSEGGVKFVTIKKYERDVNLRKYILLKQGYVCSVCNFNFKDFYGEWGANFAEVHHITPLSKYKNKVLTNPNTDLIVLCSNCHRMIHRKKGITLTVEELKSKISEKKL